MPEIQFRRLLHSDNGIRPRTLYLGKDAGELGFGQARRQVLVVDDEAGVRTVTARMLTDAGYQVHEAASGRDALRFLESHPETALAIVDIVMPEMDGITLAVRMAKVVPACRVLLMSGYRPDKLGSPEIVSRFSLLLKPFSEDDLAKQVRLALRTTDQ
jgi:DNA-binding NtrC family response regulator